MILQAKNEFTRVTKNEFTQLKWMVILYGLIFTSCVKTFQLSETERSWMPYRGNETLVFISESKMRDTVFLIGKETLWAYPDPLFSRHKYESLSVFSQFKDIYDDGLHYRYLQSTFLSLKKTTKSGCQLSINFNATNATFYRFYPINIDSLRRIMPKVLKIGNSTYHDVYIIDSDGGDFYKERNNFVTRIYWSKSSGLIRFDKEKAEYWELANE